MAWTTPQTWLVLEQLTAAKMNEQVRDNLQYLRDNLQYLYDETQLQIQIGTDHDESEQATTSTSYTDTTVSASVTTTQTCTLCILATASLRTQGGGSYPAYAAIHNGSTQIREQSTFDNDYRGWTWQIVVTGRAAGTYTYKIQFKITPGSTARLRRAALMIIAVPE